MKLAEELESVWSAVKKKLAAVGGSTSIDVLKALVTQVVKGELGLTELELAEELEGS